MSWKIESVLEASVAPAAVFALYLDPDTWSTWGHNATWARANGPLVEGGIVEVRAGYGTVYRCLIRRFEPGRALELVVKPLLMTVINTYEVDAIDGGARIRHALEISGPLATVTRMGGLDRIYQRRLDAEVAAVARQAGGGIESRPAVAAVSTSLPQRIWRTLAWLLHGGRERPAP